MRNLMIAAALLLISQVARADDSPAARPATQRDQPRVVPAQPAQRDGAVRRADPTTLARYEEEAEVLEAQLAVKQAYVKAADVGVMGSKAKFNRVAQLGSGDRPAVSNGDVEQAKIDMEAAMAQLDIRRAEMKEIEVKLKYAKKRLDEAKAPPAPRPNPGRGDPGRGRGDPRPKDPMR